VTALAGEESNDASLRVNTLAREATEFASRTAVSEHNVHERRIFLRGIIAQKLAQQTDGGGSIGDLEELVRERQDRVQALESIVDELDIPSIVHEILDAISDDMTAWRKGCS
jgi:hypothetical protein